MPICAKCNTIIKPAALACTVSGKDYHPTCVHCSVCDRRLWGIPFVRTKDGKLVCEKTCSDKPTPPIRSETRTLMRNDDDSFNDPPAVQQSTSKLTNFNPHSFESQLGADLTPRPKIDDSINQTKKCKACLETVFKKRFITFENGDIICNDCDLKNTPRPARIKSAHLILCSICNKTVKGTRYITETNGKIICEKCELTGQRCMACRLLFKLDEDHRVLTNGDRIHFDCFNCDSCGSKIGTDDFYETESNQTICLNCYEISKLPKCSKCNSFISGQFLMIENEPIHASCFKCSECAVLLSIETGYFKNESNQPICSNCNFKSNVAKCSKCSNIIQAEGVSFANKDYHQNCFKCNSCQVDLLRMKQILTDKQGEGIYCSPCFIQQFAPKCDKCHGPIAPHQMATKYEEKTFHRECFLCARCKKTLVNKKFFKAGNILICEVCF